MNGGPTVLCWIMAILCAYLHVYWLRVHSYENAPKKGPKKKIGGTIALLQRFHSVWVVVYYGTIEH